MAGIKVIVFGATGHVGSQVAIFAHKFGAEVILAMRNTSATIRGLTPELESQGFERVQVDLTKLDTVKAVLQATKPKKAFLYLVHRTPDHMESIIQAMRDEGVENVVFLSSFLLDSLENVPQSSPIAWAEAQVELNLRKHFPKYISLRPGGFAKNILRWKPYGEEVKLYGPDHTSDFITNTDMGEVGARVLIDGSDQQAIYLHGSALITQQDAINDIAKVFNRQIKLISLGKEEGINVLEQAGIPKPVATYLANGSANWEKILDPDKFKEGQRNIEKYTGHPPTTFADWVNTNRDLFQKPTT